MNDSFINLDHINKNHDRDEKIIKMVDSGLSYAEIGRQVGLTRARVSQIAIKHGYIVRPSLAKSKENKS